MVLWAAEMGTSVTRTGWIPICPTNLFKTYFMFNNFLNFFLDVINILQAFKPNCSKKKVQLFCIHAHKQKAFSAELAVTP